MGYVLIPEYTEYTEIDFNILKYTCVITQISIFESTHGLLYVSIPLRVVGQSD